MDATFPVAARGATGKRSSLAAPSAAERRRSALPEESSGSIESDRSQVRPVDTRKSRNPATSPAAEPMVWAHFGASHACARSPLRRHSAGIALCRRRSLFGESICGRRLVPAMPLQASARVLRAVSGVRRPCRLITTQPLIGDTEPIRQKRQQAARPVAWSCRPEGPNSPGLNHILRRPGHKFFL